MERGEFDQKEIQIRVTKKPRIRSMRLSVHRDGRVTVTTPSRTSEREARAFAERNMEWIVKKLQDVKKHVSLFTIKHTEAEEKHYRKEASMLVAEKIKQLNSSNVFSFSSISIRNQKTRWGSCSSKKHLSFNYKIVLLPSHLQDYLIVHELCHLHEMNHSPKFWKLVGNYIPVYREASNELRKI